ncbi:Hypothetical predicted protein [Octopus vulgaris]|uniref:Uncharacterized protein n=1 Tax=Octopus vulgaris TaxID=6645 RepID=A0AA36FH09_OCTVU|nr:Hypothetical predicted protein [Octopus vulgaris]
MYDRENYGCGIVNDICEKVNDKCDILDANGEVVNDKSAIELNALLTLQSFCLRQRSDIAAHAATTMECEPRVSQLTFRHRMDMTSCDCWPKVLVEYRQNQRIC